MLGRNARIAVIGCGKWGRNHVRTLASIDRLHAVADEQGKRSFDLAAEFGCAPLAPSQVFEDPKVDGIVLALPAELHAPLAIRAVEAGKHVLAEKPVSLSVEDGEKAVEAARRADRVFMVGHILRHNPAVRALVERVRSGAIGEVRHARAHRMGFGRFHPSFDAAWDLAPHDLSLVLAVTDERPNLAVGRGADALGGSRDSALIYLGFPSGLSAHVAVSRICPVPERRFIVTGTTGSLVFDDLADWPRKLARYRHSVEPHEAGGADFSMAEPEFISIAEAMPLTEELLNFAGAIEGTATPLTPASDGVEVVRILERALPFGG